MKKKIYIWAGWLIWIMLMVIKFIAVVWMDTPIREIDPLFYIPACVLLYLGYRKE